MPEARSLKTGAVAGPWQYNLGTYGSSSFFSHNQDEYGGIKPCKISYSCCSGGLFMDESIYACSSFLKSSDKISDSSTLFSCLPLLHSLFHHQQEPSFPPLIQRGNSCSEKYFRLSPPNAFSSDILSSRANETQNFGSENEPLPLFRARENGTEHSPEKKRCRTTGAEDRFLSLSLSMKDNGDVLQASTSFLAQKSLVDSATVVDGKDTIKGVEVVTEEVGNEPKQATRENPGFKLEAGSAFNTTKHLWAGAVAAMISRTFVAPLERLKLEYIVRGEQKDIFQLVQSITASQGLRGFWKGNVVNLLRTAPFKAVNFYAYDTYRKILLQATGNEEATNFERFVAGAAAGITATILCLPMDTIRTKMVAPGGEALGGVICVCRHMIQTEGFFSLYKGLLPAIISMAPSGAVFYGVYDILKTAYLRSPEGKERLCNMHKKVEGKGETGALEQLELGPLRTLLYGAIAGACAEAATYPFEVVRRQLQMQVPSTRLSALATCAKLVDQGGIGALYAGLTPSLLQVLPSAALSYFVYECMKIILHVR